MLFLSDDVNPKQRKRKKSAMSPQTSDLSARHAQESLVPLEARRRASMGNMNLRRKSDDRYSSDGGHSSSHPSPSPQQSSMAAPAGAAAAGRSGSRRRSVSFGTLSSSPPSATNLNRAPSDADIDHDAADPAMGSPGLKGIERFEAFTTGDAPEVESLDGDADIESPRNSQMTKTNSQHSAMMTRRQSVAIAIARRQSTLNGSDEEEDDEFAPDDIPSSLYIFSGTNPFRLFCLGVVQNFWFHQFILVCIIVNSITLAMDQPAVDNPDGLDLFLMVSEFFFTAIFFIEMVLKVVALGFVMHQHAYLRVPWNVLDFIIVIASIISLFTTSSNLTALRVVRVLRPLRSVSRIKNLRLLIAGLFMALPEVVNNLLLFMFITLVFAIAAVQLWSGTLSQRCYVNRFETNFTILPAYDNLSTPYLQRDQSAPCGGTNACIDGYGNGSSIGCEIHRDIYRRRNLNYDNFFASSLLVFKVMTFDNWPDDLADAMNAVGPSSIAFFVLLTLIGGYVCVNLFLAVLTQGYSKAAHQIADEEDIEFADADVQTDFDSPTELSKAEETEVEREIASFKKKRAKAARKVTLGSSSMSPQGSISHSPRGSVRFNVQQPSSSPTSQSFAADHSSGGGSPQSEAASSRRKLPAPGSSSSRSPAGAVGIAPRDSLAGVGTSVEVQETELCNIRDEDADRGNEPRRDRLNGDSEVTILTVAPLDTEGTDDSPETRQLDHDDPLGGGHGLRDWDDDWDAYEDEDKPFEVNPDDPRCAPRQLIGILIVHRYTEIFMMLVTLLNVVVLAIDHYGIDPELERDLNAISIACTVVFAIEIFTKIFAFGPSCLKNGFNMLDFILVVVSIITMSISGGEGSGFSAFRALRVFRVFRLLSKFESLQTVIDGILQSVASIGYLSLLILLFLYVAAIMGMQVFGKDYGVDDESVRDSFGTIWQSAILTFIVVTGDNWTDKMQVAMGDYSNGLEIIPVVYFVGLYMIGNFILINLSVAIIVDKLQEKMEALDAKHNAEEHPPLLYIAPYPVGMMAYKDAVKAEISAMLSGTMSGEESASAHSGSFIRAASMRRSQMESMLDNQPAFSQVIAPRTHAEAAMVERALDERDQVLSASARLVNVPSQNVSGSAAQDESHNLSMVSSHSSQGGDDDAKPTPPLNGLAPVTDVTAGKSSDGGSADDKKKNSTSAANVLSGTMNASDADALLRKALQQQDEEEAAQAAEEEGDGGGSVPLTEARYRDHLQEDHKSVPVQIKLFCQYMKGFFIARPLNVTSRSLYYFTEDNPIRAFCMYLVGLPVYNGAILLVIFINVIMLMLDGPEASKGTQDAIAVSDYIFATIFVLEMIIKIIALGGVYGDHDDDDDSAAEGSQNDSTNPSDGNPLVVPAAGADDEDAAAEAAATKLVGKQEADDDAAGAGDRTDSAANLQFVNTMAAMDFANRTVGGGEDSTEKRKTRQRRVKTYFRYTPPYFRDGWNVIDCFVTLISVIGLFVPLLKALRALRTIRLVARIETTRIILVALVQAVPHVMHGLLLSLVVFLVFGILGVQLFKGRLYRCNDEAITLKRECIGTYLADTQGPVFVHPTNTTRQWERTTYHFDHLGAALMTLFVVSIGDGWSDVMFDGMDIVDDETALRRNNSPWMSLYFITVFIACNFFAINMMIGILINYFAKKKKEQDGSALLTPKQRQYVRARGVISSNSVGDEPIRILDNDVCRQIHEWITYRHPRLQRISIFDLVMLVFIIINVVAVAAEYDNMSTDVADTLGYIQLGCLIVFTVEMVIKWAAYGPFYFTTNWNRFDFIIVVVGWISYGLPAIKFLSFLRVFRVVKLIRDTGVEKLIFILIRSIASLGHVVIILLLTYFIFAVAGVALFADVKFNGAIDENNNFRTVWNGMLVLYQCATTENWNGVMEAVSVRPPECDEAKGECGNTEVAMTFFILYMVSCTFIALQLFVAIIVEIFDDDADDSDPVRNAFGEMRTLWVKRYGENAGRVHYTALIDILPEFPTELTDFEEMEVVTRADMIRLLASLPIPIDSEHCVRYSDVVNALAFKKYQIDTRTMGGLVEDAMSTMFIGVSFAVAQVYALDVIADLWQQYKGESLRSAISKRRLSRLAAEDDHAFRRESDSGTPQHATQQHRKSIGEVRPSTAAVAISIEVPADDEGKAAAAAEGKEEDDAKAQADGAKADGAKADGAKADGAQADGAKAAAPPVTIRRRRDPGADSKNESRDSLGGLSSVNEIESVHGTPNVASIRNDDDGGDGAPKQPLP